MKLFLTFLSDERGASAAEYALILGIIAASIITSGMKLGKSISNADFAVSNALANAVSAS
jgi:pilus assembly protein Flp/PilA